MCTGLNVLTDSLNFLSSKWEKFLVFIQRIEIRFQPSKLTFSPFFFFKKKALEQFYEENKCCWSRQEELLVFYWIWDSWVFFARRMWGLLRGETRGVTIKFLKSFFKGRPLKKIIIKMLMTAGWWILTCTFLDFFLILFWCMMHDGKPLSIIKTHFAGFWFSSKSTGVQELNCFLNKAHV